MKNNYFHIIATLGVLVLLGLLVDPFGLLMPVSMFVVCLVLLAFAIVAIVALVASERENDERDMQHAAKAGRVAYISGVLVLTVALITQGLAHAIDPWIAFALAVMVISRLSARLFYAARN